MNLGIYSRNIKDNQSRKVLDELLRVLDKKEIKAWVYENTASLLDNYHGKTFNTEDLEQNKKLLNWVISIGGDGTLLDLVPIIKDSEIPVLGINTGRLGFLASISIEQMESAIDELIIGSYHIDKRSVLQLESDQIYFGKNQFALNDFVVHKNDSSSMITINTYLNGEFLNAYWADGLIVCTPTGSTGYSLSCGGPILFPQSLSFALTPIAPHNLNVRPIVISDENVISFEVEGRSSSFLISLDSRSISVGYGAQLAIRKADFSMNLIELESGNYLETLRRKLMWGMDNRNTIL